jgi:hypothetical protein
MNGTRVFAVWVLSLSILFSNALAAETVSTRPAFVAKIKLDIDTHDQIQQAIFNAIAERLRAVPGVQLVQVDPQWTIEIITTVVQDDQGGLAAVGLSEVVVEHGPHMKMLQTFAQAWRYLIMAGILQKDQPLDQGLKQLVAMVETLPQSTDLTTVSAHRMCVVAPDQLARACGDIVNDFDGKILRPYRMNLARGDAGTSATLAASSSPDNQSK